MKPGLRSLAVLAVAVTVVAGVYLARGILIPFLLAGVIAYTLNPVVSWLEGRGVRRTFGVPLVLASLVVGLALVLALLVPELALQLRQFSERLPGYARAAREKVEPLIALLPEQYIESLEAFRARTLQAIGGLTPALAGWVAAGLRTVLTSVAGLLIWLLKIIVIPVFTYYLLSDYKELGQTITGLIPAHLRSAVAERVSEVDRVLRAWLKGQLTVGFLLAIIYSIGLTLLGVPLGLLIGILGGFANMVPYLGLLVGFVPAALLSFLDTGSWVRPALVAAVFVGGQVLEGTVIAPRIVGGELGLPPALVLLSVLVGGELFGFTGLLLAVPTAAAGLVLLKHLGRSYDDAMRPANQSRPFRRRRPRA